MSNPPEFTPTKFTPAAAKLKFAEHFIRFVEAGFPQPLFRHWFYVMLISCRGHIAHYNELGFYAEQFADNYRRMKFIEHWIEYPVYGDPAFTFSDVETYLRDWLIAEQILDKWVEIWRKDVESRERAELKRLLGKYPQ